jgi:hypothetical protein
MTQRSGFESQCSKKFHLLHVVQTGSGAIIISINITNSYSSVHLKKPNLESSLPSMQQFTIGPTLSQMNLAHSVQLYYSEIHFNIIVPYMSSLPSDLCIFDFTSKSVNMRKLICVLAGAHQPNCVFEILHSSCISKINPRNNVNKKRLRNTGIYYR